LISLVLKGLVKCKMSDFDARSLVETYNLGESKVPVKFRNLVEDFVVDSSQLAELSFRYWKSQKSGQETKLPNITELMNKALRFHTEAGTLTKAVADNCRLLKSNMPLLRIAHQPNVFPYLAVIVQFFLLRSASVIMSQRYGISPIELYLIVDYDTAGDSRFRTAHYPDVNRKTGVADISAGIPSKSFNKPMFALAKPDRDTVDSWLRTIRSIIRQETIMIRRSNFRFRSRDTIENNFAQLESMIWDAHSRAKCLTDFNAFFLSQLVNKAWGFPTLFIRESEIRTHPHSVLTEKFISDLKHAEFQASSEISQSGVDLKYKIHPQRFPMWYFCDACLERLPLTFADKRPNTIATKCPVCKSEYAYDLRDLRSKKNGCFAPSVILEDLLDIIDLSVAGGSLHVGGAEHVILSNCVAKHIHLPVFPQCVWRPRTVGFGTSELLSISFMNDANLRDAPRLERILSDVSKGRITILYYLANSGVQLFKDSWMRFLGTHKLTDKHVDVELCPLRSTEPIMEQLVQKP